MALAILTLERGIVGGLADDRIMHLGAASTTIGTSS